MNNEPLIYITVLDEQSARQDELRELYLKWLSENESRMSGEDRSHIMRPGPDRKNVNSCTW